jgi:hypothetical protein
MGGQSMQRAGWRGRELALRLRQRRRDRFGCHRRDRKTAPGTLARRLLAERALLGQGQPTRLEQLGGLRLWRIDVEAADLVREGRRNARASKPAPRMTNWLMVPR